MSDVSNARTLLHEFKGDAYLYGAGVLPRAGEAVARLGTRPALVRGTFPGSDEYVRVLYASLAAAKAEVVGEIEGARPNAPREDVRRIAQELQECKPDVLVTFGGGSNIDAVKAAEVLRTLGGEIDDYLGTGLVTKAMAEGSRPLTPHVAIQTVASSAAHLTKYSNITDVATGQKKLMVDEALVPQYSVFDYQVTYSQPPGLTADGAMDGWSHALEVLYGSTGKPVYPRVEQVASTGVRLVILSLPAALETPDNPAARESLCLATDLGGYAIMLGGTNGAHLTSFSLVDILSHGRACAIMNPYYTVFFAPAIEEPLRAMGAIYKEAGYLTVRLERLRGRDLGLAVAEAMLEFALRIGFPTRLSEVRGFSRDHIARALAAAKDPQLKMKLENMPVPLSAEMVDDYMGPVLEAAQEGDLRMIRNVHQIG